MAKIRLLTITFILLLIASCATRSYLGTRQSSLTTDPCAIAVKQCFFSDSSLSNQGRKSEIRGFYSLENTGDGAYTFNGSVKFEYDDPVVKTLEFIDLTFVFFKDDVVVHEEIVKVKGRVGNYLEFSRLIKSDTEFESSEWVWYEWKATELGAF